MAPLAVSGSALGLPSPGEHHQRDCSDAGNGNQSQEKPAHNVVHPSIGVVAHNSSVARGDQDWIVSEGHDYHAEDD